MLHFDTDVLLSDKDGKINKFQKRAFINVLSGKVKEPT